MNYSLLSLSQLEHDAVVNDNNCALAILSKLDKEVERAIENAITKNDADYNYEIYDAVNAIEYLIDATWYKVEESKQAKDRIIYMIDGLHEDTSPYNNQTKLWKYKGSDVWQLEVNAGQYGEQTESSKFRAAGFKEAQQVATKQVILFIKKGLQLNI